MDFVNPDEVSHELEAYPLNTLEKLKAYNKYQDAKRSLQSAKEAMREQRRYSDSDNDTFEEVYEEMVVDAKAEWEALNTGVCSVFRDRYPNFQ